MSNSDHVCLGEIVGTHGVKGELRINTFTEDPHSLNQYGVLHDTRGREYDLTIRFVKGRVAVCSCEWVTTPEDAKKLQGTELFVPRAALPDTDDADGFYLEDLVGMRVKTRAGKVIGTIKQMHNFGAGDIAEIEYKHGKSEMFLFNDDNFPTINVEQKTVLFEAPEELIAQDDAE